MKSVCIISVLLTMLFSCVKEKSPNRYEITKTHPIEIVAPEFQSLLDSAKINGSILIYDISKNTYHSNNFDWARKGKLPASTFKIPNSIIGLELGIVENDSTLFKWDGQTRSIKNWNQDLIFRDAFKYSCVPCYQDLARRIGAEDMSKYVDKLEYGNIQFEESNLDIFWLEGASRISQIQQLDFLNRLYTSQLPISKRTETIVKKMMVLEKNENYILSGKTGWSISNRENNGWFVGWLETQSATYLFATNVDPSTQFNMKEFPRIRKKITMQAFQQMNIIPKN